MNYASRQDLKSPGLVNLCKVISECHHFGSDVTMLHPDPSHFTMCLIQLLTKLAHLD